MLIRGHEQHERPDLAPHQPESHGEADDDEGERAALAEEQAGLDRGVARQTGGEAQAGGDGRLEDEETGDRRQIQNGSLANSRSSMPMATDIKKRPSIRPHQRPQDEAAAEIDSHDDQHRLAERQGQIESEIAADLRTEHAADDEMGTRPGPASAESRSWSGRRRCRAGAARQEWHDDGRRRVRETGAQVVRGGRRVAEPSGDEGDDCRRDDDLQRAEAEGRRIDQSRSIDSSRPIMKRRKMTPSSAKCCMPARSAMTSKSHCHLSASSRRPYGPIIAPTTR
jgi:hypothetical protein